MFVACLSLLSMQMAGAHWHLDVHGQHAGLHGSHIHQADGHGHDHGADRDVSVLEKPGITWSKLLPQLLIVASSFFLACWVRPRRLSIPFLGAASSRLVRWRPPLRAPPLAS
ncbi:hypothetical protein [Porticoccus sp.]